MLILKQQKIFIKENKYAFIRGEVCALENEEGNFVIFTGL